MEIKESNEQKEIIEKKREYVYWELQNRYSQLCGMHCINALLQGPFVSEKKLFQIAKDLDEEQKKLLGDQEILGEDLSNMDKTGNFNIQVITKALSEFNVELHPIKKNECQKKLSQKDNQIEAVVFNSSSHWFCIRKIDNVWYNLNSANSLPGPQIISDFYLDAFIKGTEEIGFTNFIPDHLPPIPEPSSDIYNNLKKSNQFLVPITVVLSNKKNNSKIEMADEDEEEFEKAIELSKKEFEEKKGNSHVEKQYEGDLQFDNIQFVDGYNNILEQSKNDYFAEIEKSLPKEPPIDEEFFLITVKNKTSPTGFTRRFNPNDKIEDIKNFAMVKFKTNGDIGLFTEKEGNILFDPSQLIKDAGLMKEECIIIKDFDEF